MKKENIFHEISQGLQVEGGIGCTHEVFKEARGYSLQFSANPAQFSSRAWRYSAKQVTYRTKNGSTQRYMCRVSNPGKMHVSALISIITTHLSFSLVNNVQHLIQNYLACNKIWPKIKRKLNNVLNRSIGNLEFNESPIF